MPLGLRSCERGLILALLLFSSRLGLRKNCFLEDSDSSYSNNNVIVAVLLSVPGDG